MARANLGALLGNVEDTAVSSGVSPTEPVTTPAPRSEFPDDRTDQAPYLRLVRKETRLRDDQLERLTHEARRLNRARSVPAARITENSLIRIAIDLLLERVGDAHGDDEAALRESLRA
jgi:hypothetical protein